jgi:photosystem II stability/assembly factor-like uncharacterized protein
MANRILGMEGKSRVLTGVFLLVAFIVFLSWYFLASYLGHRESLRIQEKTLTAHDDLLAIDGRHNGNKAAVGKFGLIFLTKDGGKTWQRQPSGTTKMLSAVSFADDEHGFVVGSGGTLLATDDGGATWRPQNSSTKDQLLGVYALRPTQVFAVGAFGTLLSTSDGGRSWSKHELKWDALIERIVKESGYVEPNLNAVYFSSPEIGWVVGEFGLVLNTKDGGQTWTSQRYGSDLPQLYAVKFLDTQRGWATGQAGNLIQTRDGGQHWSAVELETKRDLYDVALEDERGVIVGDRVVFVSHDGGSSWKSMGANPQDQWLSGVALKSSEALAVGQAGTTRLLALDNVASEKGRKAP